jgi:hypothetical protein
MNRDIIAKIQSFGFSVYMRKESDTWLLFTDGKNIGYLQDGPQGFGLSTVHKPNQTSGTGYQIERHEADFDKADLEICFVDAPGWADFRSRATVKKYRDITEYIAANSFNQEYKLVPALGALDAA